VSISSLEFWFFAASCEGWLYESIYSLARKRHWERRGFLFAPMCPIYGIGVVAALLLFDRPEVASGAFPFWGVFIVSMVGSAIMEYVVSVVLERWFGAVWWDYSKMPLNLNGRICLPASVFFGLAGVAVVYLVIPIIHSVDSLVPNYVFEVVALVVAFGLGADLATTVLSLSDLMEKIVQLDHDINAHAEERVQRASEALHSVPEHLQDGREEALERIQANKNEAVSKFKDSARSSVEKAQEARDLRRAKAQETAAELTERQIRLLAQLRRFSSHDARKNAESIRLILKESKRETREKR